MLANALHDRIHKLRIAGHVDDSLSFQLRLQSLLSPLSFGVSPSAVVCIRAVRDPLPGSLRPALNELAGGHEWSKAVVRAVEDKIKHADRARHATSRSEAVIFADHAELMACMVDDWLHGRLLANWWWQSFLRFGSPLQTLKSFWQSAPQYIPATLQFLSGKQCATTLVRKLSAGESAEFLNSIVSSFSLTELNAIVDRLTARTAIDDVVPEHASQAAAGFIAPWHSTVPETRVTELEPIQEFFLGVALMIQRAPSKVRSRTFAREVARWQRQLVLSSITFDSTQPAVAVVRSSETQSSPIQASPTDLIAKPERARQALSTARGDRTQPKSPSLADTDSFATVPVISKSAVENIAAPDQLQPSPPPSPAPPIAENATAQQPSHQAIVPDQRNILTDRTPPIAGENIDETTAEVSIETNLGGMFYLINLALYLNLYGDFTTPLATGIELNIWDFVSLVGGELIGVEYGDDPLWLLLANLAGREEDEPAGNGFKPADEWRLPSDWLLPFKKDRPWKWSSSHGRLRLIHAEGFAILDLPLAKNPRAQLRREIKPYEIAFESLSPTRLQRSARSRSKSKHHGSIRRWLSLLMPYVRARLRVALGLESDNAVAQILCRRSARVRLTGAHVDVFFPLSDLPVEIRMAGLDRDPGWVPAAGRFIAFHFD